MPPTRPETPPLFVPPVAPCPVVLGLGANLGEPVLQLRAAIRELEAGLSGALRVSSLYRTAAWGLEQADFWNAAALLDHPGDLHDLLDAAQRVEQGQGRVRDVRWGPRTLDVDILYAGSRLVASERLIVPHPLLPERAFALVPLLELLPDAVDPRDGQPYGPRLAAFHSQRIERVAGPEWAE